MYTRFPQHSLGLGGGKLAKTNPLYVFLVKWLTAWASFWRGGGSILAHPFSFCFFRFQCSNRFQLTGWVCSGSPLPPGAKFVSFCTFLRCLEPQKSLGATHSTFLCFKEPTKPRGRLFGVRSLLPYWRVPNSVEQPLLHLLLTRSLLSLLESSPMSLLSLLVS